MFLLSGHERYEERYFVFTAAPLAVLMMFAIEEPFRLLLIARPRLRRFYLRTAALWMIAAVAVLLLPGAARVANYVIEDYRAIAALVVNFSRFDREAKLTVYEVSRRPTLNYYLERGSRTIRVTDLLTLSQERRGEFAFDKNAAVIAETDYFILAFTHHHAGNFPKALSRLSALYEERFRMLNRRGDGIIVYKVGKS